MTGREAKEFLISRILAEADRQGISLDDIERRMLYFTETAWMPEDTWEASEEFDRSYNQAAFEEKITQLFRDARNRDSASHQQWTKAIGALDREDHYLSVMIHGILVGTRPPFDGIKLILTALLIVALIFAGIVLYSKTRGHVTA